MDSASSAEGSVDPAGMHTPKAGMAAHRVITEALIV